MPVKKNLAALTMIVLGAALMLVAGFWLMRANTAPALTPGVLSTQTLAPTISPAAASPLRISLADAKAAYDGGQAIFLDVRSASAYARAHIAGAISIPEEELPARLSDLDPQAWIITYCS